MWYGGHFMGYGVWWPGMFMGLFGMILLIVAAGYVFRWIFRGSHYSCGNHFYDHKIENTPNTLEILKQRYAKGEITKEEFEQIKKDINS